MKNSNTLFLMIFLLLISLSGCSEQSSEKVKNGSVETQSDKSAEKQALPEVNHENCKLENIQKITDRHIQEEFSGLCLRRVDYKPSPKVDWKF